MMADKNKYQVLIGGEAGQGVILAGVILAEAATKDGKQVAQAARYGAAVRGGEATADVVISSENIDYPHVEEPDFLMVLSQPTYDRFAPAQAEGTLLIYDPFFVKPSIIPNVRQVEFAATDTAIKEFGKGTSANLLFLGALSEFTGVVSVESLRSAVEQGVSPRFRESSFKALELGREMARASGEEVAQ